jgi:hypothetical protein
MRMLDETLADATARRWRVVDALLPRPAGATGGCGAELVAAGQDGRPLAAAGM